MKKKYLLVVLISFCVPLCFSTQSIAQSLDDDDDYENVEMMPDPVQPYNEFMTNCNRWFRHNIADPAATGLSWILPKPVRKRIDIVRETYAEWPVQVATNALQIRFKKDVFVDRVKRTGIVTVRPLLNILPNIVTLVSYDFAAKVCKMPAPPKEDFGQVFGSYGAGHFFYFEIPIMGPSSGRDALGLILDNLGNPISWFLLPYEAIGATVFTKTNSYSLDRQWIEGIEEDTLNQYIAMRNMYFQYRNAKVEE